MAVNSLATQLVGLHKIAALVLKNPTIVITDDEGTKLAQALKNLGAQYNVNPNPAVMAWLQLAGVSVAIYGPRIALAVAARKATEAQQKARQQSPIPTSPVTMTTQSPQQGQQAGGSGSIRWN